MKKSRRKTRDSNDELGMFLEPSASISFPTPQLRNFIVRHASKSSVASDSRVDPGETNHNHTNKPKHSVEERRCFNIKRCDS